MTSPKRADLRRQGCGIVFAATVYERGAEGRFWPGADFHSISTEAATACGYHRLRPARATALQRERSLGLRCPTRAAGAIPVIDARCMRPHEGALRSAP